MRTESTVICQHEVIDVIIYLSQSHLFRLIILLYFTVTVFQTEEKVAIYSPPKLCNVLCKTFALFPLPS